MEAAGKRYVAIPNTQDTSINIWGLGDIHLGNPGCDLKNARRDVAAVEADPNSFWIGLGDYADYISVKDKRFDAESLDDGAKLNIGRLGRYYAEQIRDLFAPIKKKCLGLIFGNHEHKYMIYQEQADLHSWLCSELETPNLRYSSIFDVVFVRGKRSGKGGDSASPQLVKERDERDKTTSNSFRFYCHHGSGGAVTPGGKLNTLIKHMEIVPSADVVMIGHVHDQKAQRLVTLDADATCSKIVERQRVGVICGSYLRTYTSGVTSYGEVKGYRPTSLGPARVTINPARREIRAEV